MFKITKQVKGRTGFKTSDQTPLTTDTKLLTVAISGARERSIILLILFNVSLLLHFYCLTCYTLMNTCTYMHIIYLLYVSLTRIRDICEH